MKVNWKIRHRIKPGDIGYLTYFHGILYVKEYGYDQTLKRMLQVGLQDLFNRSVLIKIKFGWQRQTVELLVPLPLLGIRK
jgi:hypothetical protein